MKKTSLSGKICERQSGTALVLALFIITVLTVVGTMVLNTSIVEIKMANNQKISSQVFYAAEAGLERGFLMLIKDFEEEGASPWGNSNYEGWAESVVQTAVAGSKTFDPAVRTLDMYINGNDPDLYKLTLGSGQTVNNCTFDLYIYKVNANQVFLMSHAHGNGGTAAVEYNLRVLGLAPYDNAIFTDLGIGGQINGDSEIAGSVYSRSDLIMGNNMGVWNNYQSGNKPIEVGDVLYDVLVQETDLNSKVQVANGGDLIINAASAQIGDAGAGNSVEGIYVTGTDESLTEGTIYADEHGDEVPDLPMPNILDGLKGEFTEEFIDDCIEDAGYSGDDAAVAMSLYADWAQGTGCWSTSSGVVWPGDLTITSATADFSLVDGDGNGITYTAPGAGEDMGTLTIVGTVVIDGDFVFGDNHLDGLNYVASGIGGDPTVGATLVVDGDFITGGGSNNGGGSFYPADGYLKGTSGLNDDINSLGVVTTGNVDFRGHNNDAIAGFFFADGQVNFNQQVKIAGTVISNYVNYFAVPDIYQVPRLKNYLPPGMPGGNEIRVLAQREWRRVY